jgi:hypothetical protein
MINPFRHCFRRAVFLTFGAFAGVALAQEKSADPIVELPKVVVTDSRELPPPESWRYAEIPGFEILSNASDKATQSLIRDFRGFSFAIDVVWPGLQPQNSPTISLIICGRGGKFDVFVPGKENATDTGQASLLLQDREQTAIVLDFQAKTIRLASVAAAQNTASDLAPAADPDAAPDPNANSGEMEIDSYKQLYREYLRYLMSRAQPHFPAWFEEGLAQLFMGMTFDERTITFAKLEDPNESSPTGAAMDHDFNRALEGRALMPFQEMFTVERDSATATNPLGSVWAKQSQAFVHYILYGEGQRYKKAFLTFLLRLQKEPPSEKLFKECFNKSYNSMLTDLRGYQQMAAYTAKEWRLPKGQSNPPPPLIALREATQSEIGRIKGDALRLAGHPQAAHTALIAPYIRGERDPRLLAALGLEEHTAGHDDRAEKFLAAAVAAKVERPRAYLELARFRYQAGLAAATASDGRLNAEQVSQVLTPLLAARTQSPPLSEIYELMSDTLARSAEVPKREMIAPLFDGVNLFPGKLALAYQTAVICLRAGEMKGAAALVEHGLRLAPNENARARFEALKAELPPAPTPAAPAPTAAPKR